MDTKKRRQFEIIDGPNKDTLFDACKYAYIKNGSTIATEFTVALGYTMPKNHPAAACVPMSITDITIVGIEHEDGSGKSLNLKGYCKADLNSFGGPIQIIQCRIDSKLTTTRKKEKVS